MRPRRAPAQAPEAASTEQRHTAERARATCGGPLGRALRGIGQWIDVFVGALIGEFKARYYKLCFDYVSIMFHSHTFWRVPSHTGDCET